MKKLLTVLIACAITMSSCMIHYYYNIGQSTSEFYEQNKKIKNRLELVRQSTEWTVFKLSGGDDKPVFFYFRNDKLVQVDRGTRSPDLIIQNNSY